MDHAIASAITRLLESVAIDGGVGYDMRGNRR
jgi:hypothetical protein